MIPDRNRSSQELCLIARLEVLTSLCIAQALYCSSPHTIQCLISSRCITAPPPDSSLPRYLCAVVFLVTSMPRRPMHNNAQEPTPPSSILQIVPNPAHRGNLRRRPFVHLRQRTPTTSAPTRRTGTCDLAAAPTFLSTAADAANDPPPPHSPPYRRVADAQMQDDKHGASTSLSRLSTPPIQARGPASTPATTGRAAATPLGGVRGAGSKTKTCMRRPQAARMLWIAGDSDARWHTFALTARGETRSKSVSGGKCRMLVAQG
jgi:hypothetical protein